MSDDGPDIATGFFNTGVDGVFHNDGSKPLSVTQSEIQVVPEPGEILLLAVGLAALACIRRRSN